MERVLDEISFVAPDLIKAPRPESGILDISAAASDAAGTGNGAATKPMTPLPVVDRPNGIGHDRTVVIDPEYVRQMVASIVKDQDLSRYIL
jgi:ATP-dependent HslUV protease ATP-binding subunit HslU